MRFVHLRAKATNKHSGYVKVFAFPLQQWLVKCTWAIPVRFGSRPSPGGSQFSRNFCTRHPHPKVTTADWLPWDREGFERLRGEWRESWLRSVCAPSGLSRLNSGLGGSKASLRTAIYPWCAISPRRDVTYCHGYELEVWSWLVHFLNRISGRWDVHARRRAGGQGAG